MSKRPAFQFYPADWLEDLNLRMCSLAAQGLWMRMICYMHQGEPYGYLRVKGRVISRDMLPELIGKTPEVVLPLIDELMSWKVPELDPDGCYFSRRMVEDEERRQFAAAQGAKGGNPNIKRKQELTQGLTHPDNQKPTPSSPSSSSEKDKSHTEEEKAPPVEDAQPPPLNWRQRYQELHAGTQPPWKWAEAIDNAVNNGMDHDVPICVLEGNLGKANDPISWTSRCITNMFGAGVRTLAQSEEYVKIHPEVLNGGRNPSSPADANRTPQGHGAGRDRTQAGGAAARSGAEKGPGKPGGPGDGEAASRLQRLSL